MIAVFSRGGLIFLLAALFFFMPVASTRAQGEETSTPSESVTPSETIAPSETITPSETTTTEPDIVLTETATAEPTVILTETVISVPTEAPVLNGEYVSGEILVKINPKASQSNVFASLKEYGELRETELSKIGVYVLIIPDGNITNEIGLVQNITGVVFVEPNYFVHAVDFVPNDPGFVGQYSLSAIRAPQGWSLSVGSPAITIAIVDSGVDLSHPDLAEKIVSGYDFVNDDDFAQDEYGHGTHVAGIAAAMGNNGLGIAGVSWGARVMPVKVLDSGGYGSYADTAAGVIWAADHGAQIINLSLGGVGYSATLDNAIQYATNRGALVIAATGNSDSNVVLYPARDADVIGVAASESSNHRAPYSNYGAEVDITAPGTSIFSLLPGGGYTTLSGTSMAAPYVSGLAAILFGLGGNASSVRNAIEGTALDIESPGWDMYTGSGLIQMDAAIRQLMPVSTHSQAPTYSSPLSGLYLPTASPTLTLVSSSTPMPATATATVSATETASATPTFTVTVSPTVSGPSAAARFVKRLAVFRSAPFCGGVVLLLLGLLLIWQTRRAQNTR